MQKNIKKLPSFSAPSHVIVIFITPTTKIVTFASQMGCENKNMQTSVTKGTESREMSISRGESNKRSISRGESKIDILLSVLLASMSIKSMQPSATLPHSNRMCHFVSYVV